MVWKEPWLWEIRDLKGPRRATQLLETARAHPDRDLVLDMSGIRAVYPNGAVPFSAVLSHLREHWHRNITVKTSDDGDLRHIDQPLTLRQYDRAAGDTLTNSVWRYETESDAQKLANMFMEALTDQVQCEEGVIDAINWCLYEVMDNVFAHSRASSGYVMMQLHKAERKCVIAVGDTGIGIQRSLAESRAAELAILRDPAASIDFALQKGATSKGGAHQGNGLFGLRRAVEINGGELCVESGYGNWGLRRGVVLKTTNRRKELPDLENHQSTLVDWQLDCSTKVRIDEALGRERPLPSELLEALEDDEGAHRISVAEIEESLGSRKLGSEIRVRIENYLAAGAEAVVLDFRGVGVVSSSFADEVLGKLAESMGELKYRRQISIDNASVTNRSLVETAINLRLESRSE